MRMPLEAGPGPLHAAGAHANLRLVLCAGLYSSASTWMFNLVRLLLKRQQPAGLKSLYMDEFNEAAERQIDGAALVLAKSHIPGASLKAMLERNDGPLIVTVRDPRDAVASMMLRWNVAFELALWRVGKSARALVTLAHHRPSFVCRYEDGFTQGNACIDAVAEWLRIPVLPGERDGVLADLMPEAIRQRIAAWKSAGVLGKGAADTEFEPETHWHAGHLGDGSVGKWSRVLSAAQAARVQYATRRFCQAFGYPGGAPLDPGTELRFCDSGLGTAFLGEGFCEPDRHGSWMIGDQAALNLPLARPARRMVFELNLTTRPVISPRAARLRVEVRVNGSVIGEVRPSRWRHRRHKLVVEPNFLAISETDRIEIGFSTLSSEPSDDIGPRRLRRRPNLCLVRARIDYD